MKKPVCRLCGTPHWRAEGCVGIDDVPFPETEEPAYPDEGGVELKRPTAPDCKSGTPHVGSNPTPATNTDETEVSTGSSDSSTERVKKWRSKNREDYNAYQREYMRRRRAGG